MTRLPILFLAASSLTALASEQRLELELHSAIRMALERNLGIQVAEFEPQIASQGVRREAGAFDPRLSTSWEYSERSDRRLPVAGQDGSVAQQDAVAASIGGLLPWGANYSIRANPVWPRTTEGTADAWNTGMALAVRQPLLRGFGTGVTLTGLRLARKTEEISGWLLRGEAVDTVADVVVRYNRLYQAQQNLEVAKRFEGLAVQLLADNTKRREIGVMADLDVTEARARAAARREAVILAAQALRTAENLLKQAVTDEVERFLDTRVVIAPPLKAARPTLDVPAAVATALSLRPDYRQALLDLERREIRVVFTANELLPRLDLVASLDLLGVDNAFARSLDRSLTNRDRNAWTAGLQFSIPIGNREATADARVAKLERAQALVDLKALEQQIIVEVDNAAGEIRAAEERITSTTESRKLAKEALDGAEERLRAGAGTTFTVLELQQNLAEAEAAEVRAKADFNIAVAEFERRTGTILSRYGVRADF